MADADKPKELCSKTHDKEDEKLTKDEYQLKKRVARKLPRRPNDVYVNKKTNFKVIIFFSIF